MINLLAAAVTAAEMADRVAKGQEIGSMFKTTPTPTEYDLYVEAKRAREAEEAAKAAKAKAKAAQAQAVAAGSQPVAPPEQNPAPTPAQ
jgi:predicted lipid-binding transport protein (Tim44 family)